MTIDAEKNDNTNNTRVFKFIFIINYKALLNV